MTQGSPPAAGPAAAPAARPAAAVRLAELAAFGPYFAVDSYPAGSPTCPPWRPLGELISAPGALAARIGEVRERLAAAAGCTPDGVEFRVAASVAQLGLCARLLSPVLGATAVGWALSVDIAQARWVPALGGPFRLSLPQGADAGAATAMPLALLGGPVRQVVLAVAAMAVSPQVLWGNVASAANGAATMIAAARPGPTWPPRRPALRRRCCGPRPWQVPTGGARVRPSAAGTAALYTACRPLGPPATAGTAS